MSHAPRHRAHAPGDIVPFGGGWVRLVRDNGNGTWAAASTGAYGRVNHFTIKLSSEWN